MTDDDEDRIVITNNIFKVTRRASSTLFFRGGLSTYKELCSIASDLNQPDLIYKFMHLANHNALWNSRKVLYTPMRYLGLFAWHI